MRMNSSNNIHLVETASGTVLLDLDSTTMSFMKGSLEELAESILEQREAIEKSRAKSHEA